MEKMPQYENFSSRIKAITEKALKIAKIGAVASVGMFLSSCNEQEKEDLKKMLFNEKAMELFNIQTKQANTPDIQKENEEKLPELAMPIDQEMRDLSFDEFLASNKISEGSDIVAEVSRVIEMTYKDIESLESKLGKYSAHDDEIIREIIEKKKEDIEYSNNIIKEYSSHTLYEKAKKEHRDAYEEYDKQHAWLNNVVASDAYLQRLSKEFDHTDDAQAALDMRRNRLNDKDYEVVLGDTTMENALGHWDPHDDKVRVASNVSENNKNVGVHEFAHDMTKGNEMMSIPALLLYLASFDDSRMTEEEKEKKDYYTDYTERDARKKELEYDLDKLGVKKYGEEFTDEHYQKIEKLQKEGKLSSGGDEFFRMTKPEYFKKIMNEIADNDTEIKGGRNYHVSEKDFENPST